MLLNARQVLTEEIDNKLLLLAIEDVTERILMEEELKESAEGFKRLFETAKDGLLLLNKQTGEIIEVNKSITEMLGYSSEELIGKKVQDAGILTHIKDFNETILELIKTGLIDYEDVLTNTRDGQFLHTDIYLVDRARLIQCNIRDISDRILTEDKVKRDLEKLAALRQIDTAILGSLDLHVTLNVLLEQTMKQLHVDAACVLLFNPHDQMLEYAMGHGFHKKRITISRIRFGQGYAGRVAMERKTIAIPSIDNTHDDIIPWHLIEEEGFKAYIGVPLIAKGQVKGVLEIFNRTPLDPDMEWLEFTETLAGQAAIALDSAELFEQLARSNSELLTAYDTTIEGWSRALDYRDKETEGHSIRVTKIAVRVCKAIGMSDEELVHVRRGALLHDIGKLGVPDGILLKPGALTDEEFAVIKKHPDIAFKLLSPIAFLRPAMDIPYCHHEKWDGSGYPRGLKGEEIPLAARIFSVVDVWDALRSDRPYRVARPEEDVRVYILSQAGSHFDPKIVDVFLSMEGLFA
jgi:PAS domain S-box-containing protein/putative nucleotidyltransferase with HDIG domain